MPRCGSPKVAPCLSLTVSSAPHRHSDVPSVAGTRYPYGGRRFDLRCIDSNRADGQLTAIRSRIAGPKRARGHDGVDARRHNKSRATHGPSFLSQTAGDRPPPPPASSLCGVRSWSCHSRNDLPTGISAPPRTAPLSTPTFSRGRASPTAASTDIVTESQANQLRTTRCTAQPPDSPGRVSVSVPPPKPYRRQP